MKHETIAICLIGIVALGAVAQPVPAAASGGPTIFRQSMTAITSSLRAVHAEGWESETQAGKPASARITSDCLMTSTSLRGRFWLRGTRFAGPTPVDNHYVMTLNWAQGKFGSRTWSRSPRTGNRWQRADSDNTALLFVTLCPVFLVESVRRGSRVLPIAPNRFQNLGAVSWQGRRAWHLRSVTSDRNARETDEFLVDQHTHYWLRFVQTVQRKNSRGVTTLSYSRFNAPMVIPLPKVGSSTP